MQQFKLCFKLENNIIPKDLDRLLVSFLKASAQNYSLDFFESIYDKSKSIVKPFTFSTYLPGAKFLNDKILLDESYFNMFFSSADLSHSIHFFNAFRLMKSKKYPMNSNSMKLASVGIQQKRAITDSEVVIKMQSPLIVRRHNSDNNTDIYYTLYQEEFGEALKENVNYLAEKLSWQVSTENFSITPIKGKKVVKNIFSRPVDGNIGIYKLTGTPELLNLLYMAGIGVRRSSGNGNFTVIL